MREILTVALIGLHNKLRDYHGEFFSASGLRVVMAQPPLTVS